MSDEIRKGDKVRHRTRGWTGTVATEPSPRRPDGGTLYAIVRRPGGARTVAAVELLEPVGSPALGREIGRYLSI